MSNSRLEKFIYAICGMDIDDLPTPLSRIETLWNCLITGEVPDFKPLSRNEKYLMAMLTDDVDALPEPASRSEKLLYKIATGETDLSDVPGYLSRYEELLKQLIESGGIGGTDFEYVLYTLNQPLSTLYTTAEGPVKSAILSGNTKLVDKFGYELDTIDNVSIITTKGYMLNVSTGEQTEIAAHKVTDFIYLKDSITKITFDGGVTQRICFYNYDKTFISGDSTSGTNTKTFNVPEGAKYFRISYNFSTELTTINDQNGTKVYDYNNDLQLVSVKMPVLSTCGKNLFGGETERGFIDWETGVNSNAWSDLRSVGYTEVIGGNKINIYVTNTGWLSPRIFEYDKAKKFIKSTGEYSVVLDNATKFVRFSIGGNTDVGGKSQVMLYYGEANSSTTYEPYKSNILTTTSKNLFNMNKPYDVITDSQATVVQDTNQITVSSSAESGIYVNANFILDKDFFAGKTVTGSCLYESDEKDIGTVQITYQDGDGEYHYQWIRTPKTFTFPNSFIGDVMLSVSANNTGTPQSNTVTVKNIQLELGSTATSYEPYSEVVLRGIGEVKDTLDGNTGELTQRIGEVVLDGSQIGVYDCTKDESLGIITLRLPSVVDMTNNGGLNLYGLVNDRFNSETSKKPNNLYAYNRRIMIVKSIDEEANFNSSDKIKQWLSQNPITVQYELTTPIVKTVDLSILDQDGQPTKLSTFNDITHVSIEAEDLLPTVDLEVPTKIEETLSTLPTLMSDISETQQLLNESIDDQAENINEVSTAMAEIHNDIL